MSSQQNLQWETVSVMNEMSKRHENEQFIRDIQTFYGKKYWLWWVDCPHWKGSTSDW